MQRLELDCFGCQLDVYRKELKGSTLLDRTFGVFYVADPYNVATWRKKKRQCRQGHPKVAPRLSLQMIIGCVGDRIKWSYLGRGEIVCVSDF